MKDKGENRGERKNRKNLTDLTPWGKTAWDRKERKKP